MPFPQPTLTAPPHNNQRLFADNYLNATLPQLPAWRRMSDDASQVMRQVQAILDAYRPSASEPQTENDLVRPILRVLGHTFEVQASLTTPSSRGLSR